MHLAELGHLIMQHGALTTALGNIADAAAVSKVRAELGAFDQRINDYAAAADVSKVELITMITNVLNHNKRTNQHAISRISAIEQLLDVALPSFTGSSSSPSPRLDQNTSFGTVEIGVNEQDLTMFLVFSMICELKAKVEVLTDRSKNTGVIFEGRAFASESEFALWFAKENPSGSGVASFVDIVSLWGFSGVDHQDTTAMLTDLVRLKQVGFASSADAPYVIAMGTRYPRVLFGAGAKNVLSTTVIEVFKTWKDWMGTGGIDGHKQKLNQAMLLAVRRHNQYCTDNLVSPDLTALAVKTAENTDSFWRAFTTYIYEEFTLLTSFKLSDKNVLLLLSNQV
jgi:hypothetical protein